MRHHTINYDFQKRSYQGPAITVPDCRRGFNEWKLRETCFTVAAQLLFHLIPLPRCHAETSARLISSAHTGQLITPGDGSAHEERVLAQESGASRRKQGAEDENKTWRETFAEMPPRKETALFAVILIGPSNTKQPRFRYTPTKD